MISYHAYKLIHLMGLFLLLLSLGGHLVRANSSDWAKYLKVSHGIGLLLLFVAGFGLLARLAIGWPWPAWTYLKLLSWVVLGAMPYLMRTWPRSGKFYWWGVFALAAFSAFLATFKPSF